MLMKTCTRIKNRLLRSCRTYAYQLAALFFAYLIISCMQPVKQPQGTLAAADPSQVSASAPRDSWPRRISSGTSSFTIYQPQLESWEGNRITARCAVQANNAADSSSTVGAVWFSARTDVDRQARMVTLSDFRVPRASFPAASDKGRAYQDALLAALPAHPVLIALDRLEADMELANASSPGRAMQVKNSVPRIMFSTGPALLVLIDGTPVLRLVAGTDLSRVINTGVLLVAEKAGTSYYLRIAGRWLQAPILEGPWTEAVNPPTGLDTALQQAAANRQVTLLENIAPDAKQSLERGNVPLIYVSTVPASLLRTAGQPLFQPVTGTKLLFAQNSSNNIFMYSTTRQYYVLIAGRWFSAQSLQGPWKFIAGRDLPEDFSLIPPDHPKSFVLASVPGTAQARRAVIDAAIPQTAAISRSTGASVTYDGQPQLRPVEGTTLTYAVNASLPVICVSAGSYYLVDNGVWFFSTSSQGPWTVAASVPAVIYTIPPGSPVHYVTYVYAYGSTPEVVYTGFTPGYYGTVVSPDNTVVYGAGYVYPAWAGAYWYPAPPAYYYYYDFDDAVHVTHDGKYIDRGYVGDTKFTKAGDTTFARNDGDLYAARDGNVYKRELGGWKQYDPDSGDWNLTRYSKAKDAKKIHERRNPSSDTVTPAPKKQDTLAAKHQQPPADSRLSGSTDNARTDRSRELDNSFQSRMEGERRVSDFRSGRGGGFQGGGFGGRGFGGGGFRGGRR